MVFPSDLNQPTERNVSFIQLDSHFLMLLDHLFCKLKITEFYVLKMILCVDDREDVALKES